MFSVKCQYTTAEELILVVVFHLMWYLCLLGVLLLPPNQSTHTLCCFCFPLPNYHSVLGVNVYLLDPLTLLLFAITV